ncbi:hypothetical protein MYA_3903 [Burkholderia sp. KJ006]|nr:hypothetical protein MYA_3903 [Burkholderia sp. KJ006]
MTLLKRQENPLSSAQVFRKIIGNSCRAIRELIRQLFPNRRCRGEFHGTLRIGPELYGKRLLAASAKYFFIFLFTSDE